MVPSNAAQDDPGRTVLAIYVNQGVRDRESGNLHRAHVLLSEASNLLAERRPKQADSLLETRQFFNEVPDGPRFERTAQELEKYMALQEERIALEGERAAVLVDAGLREAASFLRRQIAERLQLIILPMIERAVARGESYGFAPPSQLMKTKRRLDGLVSVLQERDAKTGIGDHREQANAVVASVKYEEALARFRKTYDASAVGELISGQSLDGLVAELRSEYRPLASWLMEKQLALRNCPLYAVDPKVREALLQIATPLRCVDGAKGLFTADRDVRTLWDEYVSEGEALTEWCRQDGDVGEVLSGGGAYFVLAWFWLEQERPGLARDAFLDGARQLLGNVARIDLDELRQRKQDNERAMVKALSDEVNAYRFLVAAAMISDAPAGAATRVRASYVPELQVLLRSWRQSWLKCGFSSLAADELCDRVERRSDEALYSMASRQSQKDRYFFPDYRFKYGGVPDVVVEKAVQENVLKSEMETVDPIGQAARVHSFFSDFKIPQSLSDNAKKLLKQR
jgi:hypothetical protein